MSPTYTMSAHLCKQIYSSWRQARQSSPDTSPLPSPPTALSNRHDSNTASYFPRPSSPTANEKYSMDSERNLSSHPPSPSLSPSGSGSSGSGSSWRGWGSR
ncbi:hypothetical protein MYCTH_2300487 [Thermothelomyces thermophilus ATCC 42464]|uniref:Ste12 interacting protein n=1 Tax=Thermothelomyces thermophilus (strain ATCC 42464 / BCRC 31852 / DSM 1799) TaxID=573729 RepID=G2Q7C6_THET4|nr:uncharacterized protein MYCTH_2300487 [Thermothelomyces thermophilus ATCC 42464]AEO56037.1 hypothetical protein MYCTH_2300487 [Thermothelomyces thermophilus ATCC 42464]